MPAEMLMNNERTASSQPILTATAPEDGLHRWARNHLERVRRLRLHVVAYVLGMVVLLPVWAFSEWKTAGGFERLSDNGQPGDWEPWILYVALIWGFVVAVEALRVYFDRPTTDAEIEREIRRLQSRG